MPNILIRNVDDSLDRVLKIKAAENGRTREAEIKAILQSATTQRRSLTDALMAIPKLEGVDVDALFDR